MYVLCRNYFGINWTRCEHYAAYRPANCILCISIHHLHIKHVLQYISKIYIHVVRLVGAYRQNRAPMRWRLRHMHLCEKEIFKDNENTICIFKNSQHEPWKISEPLVKVLDVLSVSVAEKVGCKIHRIRSGHYLQNSKLHANNHYNRIPVQRYKTIQNLETKTIKNQSGD